MDLRQQNSTSACDYRPCTVSPCRVAFSFCAAENTTRTVVREISPRLLACGQAATHLAREAGPQLVLQLVAVAAGLRARPQRRAVALVPEVLLHRRRRLRARARAHGRQRRGRMPHSGDLRRERLHERRRDRDPRAGDAHRARVQQPPRQRLCHSVTCLRLPHFQTLTNAPRLRCECSGPRRGASEHAKGVADLGLHGAKFGHLLIYSACPTGAMDSASDF